MKILLSLLTLILFISCKNNDTGINSVVLETKYDLNNDTSIYSGEMKRYWLVLLTKGPYRDQDSIVKAKIQQAHLANINRLVKKGKIVMAGPIGADNDIQGIFLMNCNDSTEVEKFVTTDTAVVTGRLVMKYYPWWTEKGKYVFK